MAKFRIPALALVVVVLAALVVLGVFKRRGPTGTEGGGVARVDVGVSPAGAPAAAAARAETQVAEASPASEAPSVQQLPLRATPMLRAAAKAASPSAGAASNAAIPPAEIARAQPPVAVAEPTPAPTAASGSAPSAWSVPYRGERVATAAPAAAPPDAATRGKTYAPPKLMAGPNEQRAAAKAGTFNDAIERSDRPAARTMEAKGRGETFSYTREYAELQRRLLAIGARTPQTPVERALQDYVTAYTALDAASIAKVYPSVDKEALAQVLSRYASLNRSLELADAEVAADGAHATAIGTVTDLVVLKSGERLAPHAMHAVFRLSSQGPAWVIEGVTLDEIK